MDAATELRVLVQREAVAFPDLLFVWQALEGRGKLLSGGDGFCWSTLSLLVAESVRAHPAAAPLLACGIECYIAALDVFDDVEDADALDALWRSCGFPTATNVATLLLSLAYRAVGRLTERGVSPGVALAIARTLATTTIEACGGQQQDLDLTPGHALSEEQYLCMIERKSGALASAVCRSSALLGTADASQLDALSQFGRHVGMALQIMNDVAGMSSERGDRNDLRAGKRTWPIIWAMSEALPEVRRELGAIFRTGRRDGLSDEEIRRVHDLLERSGAFYCALTLAEVCWERALLCLDEIPRLDTAPLKRYLAQLRGDDPSDAL